MSTDNLDTAECCGDISFRQDDRLSAEEPLLRATLRIVKEELAALQPRLPDEDAAAVERIRQKCCVAIDATFGGVDLQEGLKAFAMAHVHVYRHEQMVQEWIDYLLTVGVPTQPAYVGEAIR